MKTAGVVFNGIQFPFTLMDQAIHWAKENKAALHAVFLFSSNNSSNGFGSPEETLLTENPEARQETEKSTDSFLSHQRKLVADTCDVEKIVCITEIRKDPTIEEILAITTNWDILFLDAISDPAGALQAVSSFSMDDLMEMSACSVAWVNKDK